jgi:hypothetical protein
MGITFLAFVVIKIIVLGTEIGEICLNPNSWVEDI